MSDEHSSLIHSVSEGGITAKHPPQPTHPVLVGPSTNGQFNTIKDALPTVACWRLNDMRFEFDSSFVGPEAAKELKELAALKRQHPGAPISIFGHADPVGTDDYNKQLSGRRAQAIYALLTRKMALWEELYESPLGGDNWGIKSTQVMLTALKHYDGPISGSLDKRTRAGVEQFQRSPAGAGLKASGNPDKPTRIKLYKVYMDFLCTDEAGQPFQLDPKKDFLAREMDKKGGKGDYQGCSEFNPVLIFSKADDERFKKAKDKTERDAANAPNRRVVVYLFRPGSRVSPAQWPCPRAKEGVAGCKKRFWSDGEKRRSVQSEQREYEKTKDTFACRFYDRISNGSLCESVVRELRIRLFDHLGHVLMGAPCMVITQSRTIRRNSNDKGQVIVFDVPAPSTCTIKWSRPKQQQDTTDKDPKPDIDAFEASLRADGLTEEEIERLRSAQGTEEEFEFELKVFVDLAESTGETAAENEMSTEAARRRLNNLGYSRGEAMEANVKAFQRDCGDKETGNLEHIKVKLKDFHDVRCEPPVSSKPNRKA